MGYWCFLSPPNQSWICVSGKTETNNTRWQSLWSGCLTWCSLQALNIWVFLLSSSHFPLLRLWSSCVVSDACAQLIVPLSLSHFSGAGCQRGSVLQWLLHESGSCWGGIVSEYSAYPSLLRTFTPLNDSPPLLREVFLAAAWQLLAVTALLALMPAMLWVQLGLPFLYQWVPCSFFQRTGRLQKSCFVWSVITYKKHLTRVHCSSLLEIFERICTAFLKAAPVCLGALDALVWGQSFS